MVWHELSFNRRFMKQVQESMIRDFDIVYNKYRKTLYQYVNSTWGNNRHEIVIIFSYDGNTCARTHEYTPKTENDHASRHL